MKNFFLFTLICINLLFNAQTLTQAFNEPAVGDSDKTYPIDTSAFVTGLPISVTGSNSIWNFSNLTITNSVMSTSYESTLSVPSSTAYLGSTVVQKQGALNTFIKSVKTPSTQTEVLGVFSNSLSLTFTNSAIAAKYPIVFGNGFSDNISGTFVFSLTGSCNGKVTTSADGAGVISLPNGLVLNNILRVKSVQVLTLSTSGFPIGTIKQTIYNYYHSSQKFPLLSINYQALSFITSPNPTVTAFVTGNAKALIAGLSQNNLDNNEIRLYPNPLKTVLHFRVGEIYKPREINIYNEFLQLVYTVPYKEKVDMYDFHNGIYLVEVKTEKGNILKKIIKE